MRTDAERFRWLGSQDRTAFLRQAIDVAMDGLHVEFDILSAIRQLRREIQTMSQTLSAQVDAATAAIKADLDALATDLTAVAAEIAALQAGMPVGSTITQEQVDALNALKASADAVKATADAMATPPAPAPAPAAP